MTRVGRVAAKAEGEHACTHEYVVWQRRVSTHPSCGVAAEGEHACTHEYVEWSVRTAFPS